MNLGIEGRTALVVGASKGIGLEVTRELRAEGCRVFTISRSGSTDFNLDLMSQGAVDLLVTGLTLSPPDIIVHVVGGSQGLTSALLPASDWARVWMLNIGIAHDINRVYIPMMARNKWGRIIHLSSNATRIGSGYGPYTSAKAALEGYVMQVGRHIAADGIVMTAVAPGIVETPGRYFASLNEVERKSYFDQYIPTRRFAQPEEIAKAVAFLASEHAGYMAGTIVQMDGGAR